MRRSSLHFVMLVLLMTVLARPLIGDRVHEVAGVFLLMLLVIHAVVNRGWYTTLFSETWSLRRASAAAVNLSLVAAMATVLITAVPISRFAFGFLAIDNGMWVAQLHITAAMWLFILASVHLGFHWETAKRVLPLPADGAVAAGGRVGTWGLLILACGLGVRATLDRNIGSKLIMYYSFDFFRAGDSVAGFIIDYLTMMVLYACVAQCASRSVLPRLPRA